MFDTYRYKTGSGAAEAAEAACSGGTSAPSVGQPGGRASEGAPALLHAMMFEFSPAIQISDKPFD